MRRGVAPLLAAAYHPECSKGLNLIFASLDWHHSIINQLAHSSHALCKHVLLQLPDYCGWLRGKANEWSLDFLFLRGFFFIYSW